MNSAAIILNNVQNLRHYRMYRASLTCYRYNVDNRCEYTTEILKSKVFKIQLWGINICNELLPLTILDSKSNSWERSNLSDKFYRPKICSSWAKCPGVR